MNIKKELKRPYRILNPNDKEVGQYRTKKQAIVAAKKFAKQAPPKQTELGYLVTHLFNRSGLLYSEEIKSYY